MGHSPLLCNYVEPSTLGRKMELGEVVRKAEQKQTVICVTTCVAGLRDVSTGWNCLRLFTACRWLCPSPVQSDPVFRYIPSEVSFIATTFGMNPLSSYHMKVD